MTISVGKPVRRLAAFALLAGMLLVLWVAIIAPAIAYLSARSAAAALMAETLARYQWLAAHAGDIEQRLEAFDMAALEALLYPGDSVSQSTALLQNEFLQLAAQSGAAVGQSRALPERAAGRFQELRVRVDLMADAHQLADLLDAAAQQAHLMRFDAIAIRAPDLQTSTAPIPLSINFEVVGLTAAGTP